MKRSRTISLAVFVPIMITLVVWALGPRVTVNPSIEPSELPHSLERLEQYVAGEESRYDLVPGAEKLIRFRHQDKRKTKFAMVYLHGFSASRRDTHPAPQLVADHLEANSFHTRLTAHGLADEELAAERFGRVSVNDWLNDAQEAIEVGKLLGDRVVVMGHSTGATLGMFQARNEPRVAALVLLSPNFGLKNNNARLALLPWGRQIIRTVQGEYFEFSPKSELHDRFWTERYRTDAIVEVIALADYCCQADYTAFRTPCLCVYSEADKIVSVQRIKEQMKRLGSQPAELHELSNPNGHGLAGEILSPSTTLPLVERITRFLDAELSLERLE